MRACAGRADMVLVAAAGNNGPKAPYSYPLPIDGVIAVTATDERDRLMPQANRGPYVYISAPGVDVVAPGRRQLRPGHRDVLRRRHGLRSDRQPHSQRSRPVGGLDRGGAGGGRSRSRPGRPRYRFGYGLVETLGGGCGQEVSLRHSERRTQPDGAAIMEA